MDEDIIIVKAILPDELVLDKGGCNCNGDDCNDDDGSQGCPSNAGCGQDC